AYVTYYNPAVLKSCGVSTMPYQLYKQGKWNWDEQNKIVRKVAAANKGYTGFSMQSTDLFMLSAGLDFASYDGSKFTNNLGSVKAGSLLTKAWQTVAELNADKVLGGWELTQVQQGKVGLFSAIAYGLYNEGAWFDNVVGGYQNLQAVPMAGPKGGTAYTPVRPKCWGVPKGAKNPEGAAYFLRYFLDVSAFNQSSTFYNSQFETVYKDITKSSTKKCVMYGWGVSDYVDSGTYSRICSALTNATPSNVNTVLNQKKGNVQTGISRANKDLYRIR
ncbi:MAG: extracellular solute-binding protein, partial [Acutalibacteraceae bacterium]|nr:extracellular solute-binding protein [Acutalibacteraceae bacterium]